MNFNISTISPRLPLKMDDLPSGLRDKVDALKLQTLTNVVDWRGRHLANKGEEWESKFAKYAGEVKKLDLLETELAGTKLPAGRYYIDYVQEIRILEAEIELQQRDLLVMVAEPVDRTEIEKATAKAINLVQTVEIRPAAKGVYDSPVGRQRATY